MFAGYKFHRFAAAAGLGLILAAGSGCAMIDGGEAKEVKLTDRELPVQPTTGAPQVGYTMEIRAAKKTPQFKQVPLTEPVYVQAVLEKNGLVKEFRRMNLVLRRASNGESHKLELKYDHASKMVDPLYDYAIHAGDHLIVIEDTSTALDDMIEAVSEPLGLPAAKQLMN